MCGICGFVSLNRENIGDEILLNSMNNTMAHRGPDDAGTHIDQFAGIAMRRLSIIDLDTGNQPISNESGTVWVVFNGEIYNYRDIRQQLVRQGHVFRTQTDTEVIIHAYEEYGDDCVNHFNGMFGFAIWDEPRQRLLLARDRLGIKPIYYYASSDWLVFGSELKAVVAHPDVPHEINPTALDQFLTLEYIPTPLTIFSNVYKLPPGYRLIVEDGKYHLKQYWDVELRPINEDAETCAEILTELIDDAVKIRLMADVPLGAFLSGGIDSSTIVSSMSQVSDLPVRTFSIGFEDSTYNELPYARMIAESFDTQHHEEILRPDIADLAEQLVGHLDEPFADFSVFPTYLVSQVARKQVKVVLSGDGGDEIFAGYDTYIAQSLAYRYYDWLPLAVRRRVLPKIAALIPPQQAKKGFVNKTKRFVEGASWDISLQHARWMLFMNRDDKEMLYQPEYRSVLNGTTPEVLINRHFENVSEANSLAQQQYVDVKTYLVDDILAKVDRMSMAVSLEARVPFLDHRVVEFGLNLPAHMKIGKGVTKLLLRQAMAKRLPPKVLHKPKEGFSIPMKHWLRGELRPMMDDLLSVATVKRRGYFRPACVSKWVSEHLERRANHSHRLWALMVFELWHRQVLDNVRLPQSYEAKPMTYSDISEEI